MPERRAALIGIDHYQGQPQLLGCVRDANSMADILGTHESGERNFDCRVITSANTGMVTQDHITAVIEELFTSKAESVLFYFAGHSVYDELRHQAYLRPQNSVRSNTDVSFNFLMDLANRAHSHIDSITILIDSCQAGSIGEKAKIAVDSMPAEIGASVNILVASDRKDAALENNLQGGFFSRIIIDGLKGRAADLRGNVTPASLYAHADHLLSSWDQRPLYKANIRSFISLRKCKERLGLEELNALPRLFPDDEMVFDLDPSFEPDRENIPEKFRHIPVDHENTRNFKILQSCNRHGLIEPVDEEHMYYAAINSTGCRLTELGKHYRMLAEKKRLR